MNLLHKLLRWLMSPVEERMISRLLRQREEAWTETDVYRHAILGMKVGEFLPEETEND